MVRHKIQAILQEYKVEKWLQVRRGTVRFLHAGGELHPSKDGEHQNVSISHALVSEWVQRLLAE